MYGIFSLKILAFNKGLLNTLDMPENILILLDLEVTTG